VIVSTSSTMRIVALLPGMVWLAAMETSARGNTAAVAAVVYERLLADRNTSCLLLFPGPEERAVCEQTRDCLDYFSRQLDFATFTSLCDVIQAAGGEQDARQAGEDKRPGPAEVRPFNHRSSLMFGQMLRKFQCCGSGMFIPDPNFFHPGSASKNLSILTPKKWFLSSRKYDPGCPFRIRI
jgi:hypothetical protein